MLTDVEDKVFILVQLLSEIPLSQVQRTERSCIILLAMFMHQWQNI